MAIKIHIEDTKPENDQLYSLQEVLSKLGKIEIPDFQREYVWDLEKVELFFNDFQSLSDSEPRRFMGVVLYVAEKGKRNKLLDGQQRIITALLSYAAAIQLVSSSRRSELYSIAAGFCEALPDNSTYKVNIEFKNSVSHSKDFIKILTTSPGSWKETGEIPSNEYTPLLRMKQNYLYFINKYKQYGEKQDVRDEYIISFIRKVFKSSRFIMISTEDLNEAFTLFESLNYRGVPLKDFELINNYIVHRYSTKALRENHHNDWDTIKNNLTLCGSENISTKLLEINWYCFKDNPFIDDAKPRDWYAAYTKLIKNTDKVERIVESLKTISEVVKSLYYAGYDFSQSDFIEEEQVNKCEIIKHVQMFRTLNYNSIVSPLYTASLLYATDYEKINDLFDKIEAYCIRNVWICNKVTKTQATNTMNFLAKTLVKTGDIESVIHALDNLLVTDSKFIDSFLIFDLKVSRENGVDSRKIKLIFSRIFDIRGLSSMDTDFTAYTIEHICAIKDRNEYGVIPEHRNRFGNITVMCEPLNKGNQPYYSKIHQYQADPALCAKCIENICVAFSNNDDSVLEYNTLLKLSAKELKTVSEDTYWSEGPDSLINGQSRFSIWANYLSKQFILHWPKDTTSGEENIDTNNDY